MSEYNQQQENGMKQPWAFGSDEDDDMFRGASSREEAIQEGEVLAKDLEQDYFYIAETCEPEWPKVSADTILDQLDDQAIECWRDSVTKEQEAELQAGINAVVDQFLKKNELVTWFSIKNLERIELSK